MNMIRLCDCMRKRRLISILVLIAYCIPYVFLGMYADAMYHSMWLYGLMVLALVGLVLRKIKTYSNCTAGKSAVLADFLPSYKCVFWRRLGLLFQSIPRNNPYGTIFGYYVCGSSYPLVACENYRIVIRFVGIHTPGSGDRSRGQGLLFERCSA